MSIKVAQQEAKRMLSRSAEKISFFSFATQPCINEHRPRQLFPYTNKRGMQSLLAREMVVWRPDKHLGTKQIRLLGAQP